MGRNIFKMKTRKVDVKLTDPEGKIIFEKKQFEIPESWSDRAALICASKYAMSDENSALDIIDRIANQITKWGIEQGYFKDDEYDIPQIEDCLHDTIHCSNCSSKCAEKYTDWGEFRENLRDILTNQRAAFNSPVWFNVGADTKTNQASACFILPIEDDMNDILDHSKREGMIFAGGSGVGINISKLRAEGESLSGGGTASGPISFNKGYDAMAGTIKSGGKNRRSARLVCMDIDHPDIIKFIECKVKEERKAKILIAGGIDPTEAYETVAFQNANHSVRITDEFMECVKNDGSWYCHPRKKIEGGLYLYKAKDIFNKIAETAWETGDPGLQFHDRTNLDNPVSSLGEITGSNPCLAGETLLHTKNGLQRIDTLINKDFAILCHDGKFRIATAFPNGKKKIYKVTLSSGNELFCTEDHRLLSSRKNMSFVVANSIDSKVELGFIQNKPCNTTVEELQYLCRPYIKSIEFVRKDTVYDFTEPVTHTGVVNGIVVHNCGEYVAIENSSCNLASLNLVKYLKEHNIINEDLLQDDIQVLVTAMDILIEGADYPTEKIKETTIATRPLGLGFSNLGALLVLMGIPYDSNRARNIAKDITRNMTTWAYEQSIKLAKQLGSFEAFEENKDTCADIAARLTDTEDDDIWQDMKEHGLRNSQLTLLAPTGTISFLMDCDTTGIEPLFSLKATKTMSDGSIMEIVPECVEDATANGMGNVEVLKTANEISWKGHIDMMAACQQHLNGAISKTINMPSDCTVEDVKEAYTYAWKSGVKSITIYRDGSKNMQPLTHTDNKTKESTEPNLNEWQAARRKLPKTRYEGRTHKFDIAGFKGYITVNVYENGLPGEIFIIGSKFGSTTLGLLNAFATAISLAMQHGVPLEHLIEKFSNTRFDPQGFTNDPDIRGCSSIIDYVFKWLALEFLDEDTYNTNVLEEDNKIQQIDNLTLDGNMCMKCGGMTQKNGSCFVCTTCGATTGCS